MGFPVRGQNLGPSGAALVARRKVGQATPGRARPARAALAFQAPSLRPEGSVAARALLLGAKSPNPFAFHRLCPLWLIRKPSNLRPLYCIAIPALAITRMPKRSAPDRVFLKRLPPGPVRPAAAVGRVAPTGQPLLKADQIPGSGKP